MLEEKQTKTIWIYDMACPQESNIEKKRLEKNRLLANSIRDRERRPGFKVKVVLLAISAFGGAVKKILKEF